MIDIVIPSVGESITEVTLLAWHKKEGEYVERDEVIAEIESEKASFEISAEKSGLLHISAKEDTTLSIGDKIGQLDEKAPAPKKVAKEKPTAKKEEKISLPLKEHAVATPLAKAVMEKEGVEISGIISASEKNKKITKKDVLNTLNFSTFSKERTSTSQKMSNLRKTISRRLVEAKNHTAMLTTFNEVDMTAIMSVRAKYKETFKEVHGVNLGFMSFFTRACCLALNHYPSVNAYIDNEKIIQHNYCDISIAVSTPKGLVVPVIRNAERLSMNEIEKTVVILATKARNGKLSMEEMQGGTFTITNGGVFGSLLSTPIINPPQSAILGMHKIEERPVVIDGKVAVRKMMYLALSYDHQVIDGKESVGFLVMVKTLLENPSSLINGTLPIETLLNV